MGDNEWVDGQINRWLGRWVYGWRGGQIYGYISKQREREMNGSQRCIVYFYMLGIVFNGFSIKYNLIQF